MGVLNHRMFLKNPYWQAFYGNIYDNLALINLSTKPWIWVSRFLIKWITRYNLNLVNRRILQIIWKLDHKYYKIIIRLCLYTFWKWERFEMYWWKENPLLCERNSLYLRSFVAKCKVSEFSENWVTKWNNRVVLFWWIKT